MKTNISINLSDEERNSIAMILAGKKVKAMVSRKELSQMVQGFVHGLLEYRPQPTAKVVSINAYPPTITPALQARLDEHGYSVNHPARLGFIRGWNAVGR